MIREFSSLTEMLKMFPNEKACIEQLTSIRWRNGEYCPYCGCETIYHFRNGTIYKCADCRQKFSIKVGTIFEDSKVPLHKWFIAIYMITSHKKGISSVQLAKDIGVTQKTAWFMMHRLREAAKTKSYNAPLKNEVEIDETYIGGKEKNKHANKRNSIRGRSTVSKSAAVALIERGGSVRTYVVENVNNNNLRKLIAGNVAIGSLVYTDEFRAYRGMHPFYTHKTVDHSKGEYVTGNAHTNSAECFFSQFKRGLIGIYHVMSKKHLGRYLQEFAFRYNMRSNPNGFGFQELLSNCEGRLTYKDLITNAV